MGKKVLLKILFSVASEILLNLSGMDDLADYSEFITQLNDGANAPRIEQLITL